MMTIRHQAGFTLVELLLVILLLSGLSLVATAYVDNVSQQMGFDQTKVRLEQIRRAIIGDTSRTLNGQPELSGFVADMGRLPESLNELVEKPLSAQAWRSVDIEINSTTVGVLFGGWRGPYLEAGPALRNPFDDGVEPDEEPYRVFRDGWANLDATEELDKANYGWVFTKDVDNPATTEVDESAQIFLQSLGADLASGPIEEGDSPYGQDFPATGNLINEHDWRVDVRNQAVQVEINRSATTEDDLRLEIYRLENGNLDTIEIPLTSTTPGIASQTVTGSFSSDQYLPIGTYALAVVCDGTHTTLYGGDCTATGTPPPIQYLKIVSRSHQLPLQIKWNTQ